MTRQGSELLGGLGGVEAQQLGKAAPAGLCEAGL
jgi:hypothetical protein